MAIAAVLALSACNGAGSSVLNAHPAPPPPVEVTTMTFAFQQLPNAAVPGVYPVTIAMANGNGGIGLGTPLAQPLNIYAVPTGSLTFGTTTGSATSPTVLLDHAVTQIYASYTPPGPAQPPAIFASTIDSHGRTVLVVLPFFGQQAAISTTLNSVQRGNP